MLPSSQRERRVSRLNRTGNNTTGWARRLTALLVTACLVMAMALPVYAEEDLLPDAPGEVELLEDEQGTASGEDTVPPEQNAATPVPDAATPEPEQSAEPEQPAPTETPEPTAEPTPTPEPAATATATPVPTVTPTATPEPTEQPQMDAEEAEDMDRALGVSTQSNQFTVYFAVPSSWEVTKNSTITFNAKRGNGSQEKDGEIGEKLMSLVPDKITSKGQRIYKIILTNGDQTICPWGGYVWMQFTLDGSHKVRVKAPPEKNNFVGVDVFNDKYYDGDANSENGDVAWNDADWANASALPNPADHTAFGGHKMVFENLSDSDLANVTAVFTEQDSSRNTTATETVTIGNVAKNEKRRFEIPISACSSVQFVAGNDKEPLSTSYNFYEQGTDENTFLYNASKKYCFTYNVNNQSTWGTPQGKQGKQVIYFDATFSGLSYENETSETHGAIGCGMPTNDGKLWCYLTGVGKDPITKEMDQLKDTNIWYYEVPEGYTKIRFASWAVENENTADNGNGTAMMDIPADLSEPCFFADASDDVIYKGGNREGYWAEKGSLRNAKEGKKLTDDVVDISKEPFTEDPNTKYVTSTLYDYYTDYELNGNNRDRYSRAYYAPGKGNGFAKQRSWVTFRQFDRALSDYYESCKAQFPIYTGHFQPSYSDWGIRFDGISAALNLWGLNSVFKNENRFMAINNSTINENGNNDGEHYDYAYQGLVKSETSTGDATGEPLLKDTKDNTKVAEPHFNKAFLSGTNTKNAKLGDVYDNVAFPFTKRQIFDEDKGVDYWYFDSQDTTLYLKQDSTTEQYFLKSSTQNREQSRNLDSDSASKTIKKNGEDVSSYGYFPFNETATAGWASTYNYGFGTKLQMDFTLTDDGKVETNVEKDGKKEKTSIKFFFSGDDDVWVFIDGQLVLDVGGSHGKVSGLLEFGEKTTDEGKKKNSVTAYVSQVKIGGTSNSDQDGSSVKDVTYNGEKISFSAQGTTLTFDKGQKHTLTMYYMERGMWESNMAVAFNFPDNNELQVQKEVDLKNVTDDDFKKCFTGQKIFNFTIQNQATHYGKTDAAEPDPSDTEKVNLTAKENKIEPATPDKVDDYIFRLDKNPKPDPGNENEQVLHWYARYMDTQSAAREKRRGILTLGNPINIENMRFLTFQVYVSQKDGSDLSLNNLYLELLDDQQQQDSTKSPGQKGSLGTTGINGATYGSVEVTTDQWVTVKLDLHKMKEQGDFNNNVTTIRVGDNYSRNIYFRDFTFIPKAVPSTMTGFTTDQKEIPDYGSAKSGHLQNAENAQYTSTMDNETQLVDKDGRFVLEAGETVTFSDQFRRGSYISLKEELNKNLYDTKWTVYENGQAVKSTEPTSTDYTSVKLGGEPKSLESQHSPDVGPDDDRTEVYVDQEGVKNDGYTENKKPTTANTIVFRSYKDPDEKSSTLTKLKVEYVNTVKTGGLKIQKQAAAGEDDIIKGTYKFKVTFDNVGGEGLEEDDIIRYVEIDMNNAEKYPDHTVTITGIPVGTRYTIEEVGSNDGAKLQSVTVPPDCHSAHEINNNTMVEGVIKEANTYPITAIFTNTQRTLINIEFDKLWKDANGTDDLSTAQQPKEIYIQLQRRLATSTNDDDWTPVNYGTKAYVTIAPDDNNGWKRTFSGLDQRPVDNPNTNYQYRIVEGTVDKNDNFTRADGTITIDGNTYGVTVTAEATPNSETNSAGSSTGNTATGTPDGTITGGSGTIVLTNTLQNPKFALDIIKKDANNEKNLLDGVEFKLEKLVKNEGKTQWEVDASYTFNNNGNLHYLTGTTGTDGKITKNPFTNLEPGRYRLTETKAHPGYNLLSKPIDIEFTQDGKYKIDDGIAKNATGDAASGYTVTLTVLNRKTPELPHTGADAPSLWLLIGMPLAVAGLLIFTFRYNRKGGRRH